MEIKEKLDVLKKVAVKLNEENVGWAVGSSSLLYFKGVVEHFNDFDLFISMKDCAKAQQCFDELGVQKPFYYDAENYGTECFLQYIIDGVDFDFMANFSIINDNVEYKYPVENRIVEYYDLDGVSIPCQSLEQWIECYRLMKREHKAVLIEEFLKNK